MSTNIVDISGVGLKQFWNLKGHMQAASTLATAHYPETLDRIFIIGAPVFFSTVWGWIKRWFDPITVSKIFILSSHEVKPVLESFIEPKNIPKKYGGGLDFEFGSLPISDPAWEGSVQWDNGHTSFPSGPLLWEDEEGGERIACFAYGTKDGKTRHERICSVPKTYIPPVTEEPEAQAVQPQAAAVAVNGVATDTEKNGIAADEATQTPTGLDTQDDAAQTADAADGLEKLKITEHKSEAEAPKVVA